MATGAMAGEGDGVGGSAVGVASRSEGVIKILLCTLQYQKNIAMDATESQEEMRNMRNATTTTTQRGAHSSYSPQAGRQLAIEKPEREYQFLEWASKREQQPGNQRGRCSPAASGLPLASEEISTASIYTY